MRFSISKSRRRAVIAGIAVLLLAASSFAIVRGPQVIEVVANPTITIATNDIRPGEAKFYAYRDDAGKQLRFLLARDAGGNIVGAVDACEVCYAHRKGFMSSNGELVCRYCGNRYKLNALQTGLASCVPVKLPFRMRGDKAEIKPADLAGSRRLFD